MTQQLSVIDLGSTSRALALPSHLISAPAIVGTIPTGDTRNRLGLKGREFHLIKGGIEVGIIETKHVDVIIVGAVPAISRQYYDSRYVEGESSAPVCYSKDGNVPAQDVKNPQSDRCNTCPQNVVGSSLNDNTGKGRACGFFRRTAVILAGYEDLTVFQLDVKSMSLWGEGIERESRYAFNDYAKKLQAHNIDAGKVITRLTFDPQSSVPKLLFQAIGYITEEQLAQVVELVESNQVSPVLDVTMSTVDLSGEIAGVVPTHTGPEPEETPAPAAPDRPTIKPAMRAPAAAAPAPAPVATRLTIKPTVRAPAPVPAPAPAPASVQRGPVIRTAPAPRVAAAPVQAEVGDTDVDALLAELEG